MPSIAGLRAGRGFLIWARKGAAAAGIAGIIARGGERLDLAAIRAVFDKGLLGAGIRSFFGVAGLYPRCEAAMPFCIFPWSSQAVFLGRSTPADMIQVFDYKGLEGWPSGLRHQS